MSALRLFALLVYTFGAFTYGALLVLWMRDLGRMGWAGRPGRQVEAINGALTIVSFLWFSGLIWQLLMAAGRQGPNWSLEFGLVALAYAFPPLIMHITWVEVRASRPAPASRGWTTVLVAAYAAAAGIPAVTIWLMATASNELYRPAMRVLGAGLPLLFILTAVYCITLVNRHAAPRHARDPASTRAMGALFGLMLLLFVVILAVSELQGGMHPTGYAAVGSVVEVIAKSLPLIFVFVSTYYESRFQFFDLFVKRGSSLLVTLAALTIWFSLTLPLLTPLAGNAAAPWLFAIAVLPIAAVTPWLYTRIGRLLDRRWLGRRYSAVDAVTRFLAALRSATSEADAREQAEESLAEIFRAPAAVQTGPPGPAPAFPVRHETTFQPVHGPSGRILLGPRAGDAPYFSEDVALVRSLADVFASVLDNLRLQEDRHTEEQRARELSLIASRSELKALRAQINPHFLFNALNAIAGLLHRDPATADHTIEKLADVFRYTLRGSETEWASLADELEFVRAYLDVEEARFGDRLHATIEIAPDARAARVPTMIVHTLVENAVKHGVASVRGGAVIDIRAVTAGGRLRISVRDNGPGFPATGDARPDRQGGGYGLVNVRERLAGHFGDAASLHVARDDDQAHTVVTLSLPLVTSDARRPMETAR
jgi:two-component sensor histidine kinase